MEIPIATAAKAARLRRVGVATVGVAALFLATACGSDSEAGTGTDGDGDKVAITLITKDSTNPFFVAMQNGAKEAAGENDVDLTVTSGKDNGDEAGQITAIENAIAQRQAGILITPAGPGVNPAIEKARDAGLYVIALDTPPDPPDIVDITFATNNITAGELIGEWTAKTLDGKDAVIALIDAYDDKLVSTDYRRHNGFLKGIGLDVDAETPNFLAREIPDTGEYNGGKYTIACQEAGQATRDDSRSAMENCLNRNPNVNVVYAINEEGAFGALEAIKAAGLEDVLVVTIDGGCAAVENIGEGGGIDATSQQYPTDMAGLGMEAIAEIARGGEPPEVSPGLDFYDTGVKLVTDEPADGVESIPSTEAADVCWGA
jgi:fructose transport system substrate-binding protein